MSIQPGKRAKFFTAFLIGLGLLMAFTLVLAGTTATPSLGLGGEPDNPVPELRLVVTDPPDACVGTQCQISTGQTFTLAVEIVRSPGPDGNGIPGYILAQTSIFYGGNVTYDFSPPAADEVVWLDCNASTALKSQNDRRIPREIGDPINNTTEMVSHGCLTGLLPPFPISEFTGVYLEIVMTCSQEDTNNPIDLLPYSTGSGPDVIAGTSGTEFRQANNDEVFPKLVGLNLFCGTPPTPTITPTITPGGPTFTPSPTPTITPTITPTPTPALAPTATIVSTFPCGDINGDRLVNAEDALWLLWFSSGMIPSLPNLGGVFLQGDVNGDGFVDPLDALFVLWIELNLFRCL